MRTLGRLDRATLLDLPLVVAVAVLQLPPLVFQDDMGRDIGLLAAAISVACALALLARRRYPVPVLLFVGAAVLLVPSVLVALAVALYDVGLRVRRPAGLAAYGLVAAAVVTAQVIDDGGPGLVRGPVIALAMGFPLVLGMAVLARRQLMAQLVDRAERAEREQRLLAVAAVAEERARLARELHDVVAHQVSLMVLHAGAIELAAEPAPAVPAGAVGALANGQARPTTEGRGSTDADVDSRGEGDAEAGSVPAEAALIGRIGRQALEELREILDVLRVGDAAAPRAPLPGVADVGELVEASRSAGASVELEEAGDLTTLPGSVARTVFRIVQEALTNARKHAPGAPVQVRLIRSSLLSNVLVEVVNGPAAGTAGAVLPGGGHGLVGVRERVGLVGGQVHAGPTDDGGWVVRATLPVAAP